MMTYQDLAMLARKRSVDVNLFSADFNGLMGFYVISGTVSTDVLQAF